MSIPVFQINPILIAAAVIPAIILLIRIEKADRLEKESPRLLASLVLFGIISTAIAEVLEMIGITVLDMFFEEETVLYDVLLYFGIVAFAANLVAKVKTCTQLRNVGGAYHGHIVQFQGSIVLDVHIDDGRQDASLHHIGITNAREVTTERLTAILHVLDVGAMPRTSHRVNLAELDRDLYNVFQFHFTSNTESATAASIL